MRRSDLGGDVIINDVPYVLHKDKDGLLWQHESAGGQEGSGLEPVSALWQQGYFNGMGHTKMITPDDLASYAYTVGLHAASYPWIEMVSRRVSVTPTVAPLDVPTFFFEDEGGATAATAITQAALTSGSSNAPVTAITQRALTSGSQGAGVAPAVTETFLIASASSLVASSYATASFVPTGNRLVLAAVQSEVGTLPTLSGGGMTAWTQVATQTINGGLKSEKTFRVTVFRSLQATPGAAAALTADFGGVSQNGCKIIVSEFGNVVTTGSNGADAVIQSATNSTLDASFLTVTLAAFASADNATYSAFSAWQPSGIVPATGFAEISDQSAGTSGRLETQWKPTAETLPSASASSGSYPWIGIGVEIAQDTATAGASSFVTASITPTINCLVLATVYSSLASTAAPTLAGCGLTWVQEETQTFSSAARRITVFRALKTTAPTPGAVTIDFGGVAQDSVRWAISEFAGVDTGGTNGSAAVIQSVPDTAASATSLTITLAAFGSSSNATYGAFATSGSAGVTPGTGFTEIHDVANLGTLETEWRNDNDTSVDATDTDGIAVAWGGIAIEIKATGATIAAFTTASITPTATGRLILAAIHNNAGSPGTPTLAGCGLTWVSVATATQGTHKVTVFRAMGSTAIPAVAGVVTIDFGGAAQTACRWGISEFAGVKTTGANGADAVVQSATNTATDAASLSITLSAFAASTNGAYGAFLVDAIGGIVPGSGFTEIHDVAAYVGDLETEWKASSDTGVDASSTALPSVSGASGSYVGTGVTGKIVTGVGFQPDLVIVHRQTTGTPEGTVWRGSHHTAANSSRMTGADTTTGIISLDADGFTVGTDYDVNESGVTYIYTAFRNASAGMLKTGSYVGNGTTGHAITGVGFLPVVAISKRAVSGTAIYKTADMTSPNEATDVGNSDTNGTEEIQSLDADGFTVGMSTGANMNGETYHYIAFSATGVAHGSYSGNDADDRAVTTSFAPQMVWVKKFINLESEDVYMRTSAHVGDLAQKVVNTATPVADRISSFTATGFTVGASENVTGDLYVWWAFGTFGASTGPNWAGVAIEIQAGSTAAPGTGSRYVYCLNDQRSTKMSVSANVISQVEQKEFGATAAMGHMAKFDDVWYVPAGLSVPFQKLTVVATGAGDTWTADTEPNYAVAFAPFQDGVTSKIARAYAKEGIVARHVALSPDGSAWADGFEVGDTSSGITSIDDSGTALSVAKADGNLYRFDATGSSIRVSSHPVVFSDANNGVGLIAIEGTNAAIWNSYSGLELFRGDELPRPIGPDSLKVNRNVAGLTHEPVRGRHYETAFVGNWIYSLYRVTETTTKTYLIALERVEDSFVLHSYDRIDGILRGLFVDSQKRLWSTSVTDGTVFYWKLGADGSPDSGRDYIGFGANDTTYSHITGEWDGGMPWTLKYLEHVELVVSGLTGDAGMTLSVWVTIDDGTAVQIGSDSTSASKYQTFYTGTSTLRSGRRFTFEVRLVTDSGTLYTPAARSAPFRIHAIAARFLAAPGTNDVVKFTVSTSRAYATGAEQALDAKETRDTLKALAGTPTTPGSVVTCVDPDGQTVYLRLTSVDDRSLTVGDTTEYLLDVAAIQYRTS